MAAQSTLNFYTRAKQIALLVLIAYITYRFIQKQFNKSDINQPPSPSPSPSPPQIQPWPINEEKEEKAPPPILKEEKVQSRLPDEIPRRYIEPTQVKGIPISEGMLTIASCGYTPLNGGYRWFLHDSKWCFFTHKKDEHFCLANNVNVNKVYDVLKYENIAFEWNRQVRRCWILSDIDGGSIYYAAPQLNDEFIPKDKEWISVSGDTPTPQIFVRLIDRGNAEDQSPIFGNAMPDDVEIKNVFRQLDVDHIGLINRSKVVFGFKLLGYDIGGIHNSHILRIMESNEDGLGENRFCVELKKYAAMQQQRISFDVVDNMDNDDNDNGVLVHKQVEVEDDEVEDGEDEEEDDSISDLED